MASTLATRSRARERCAGRADALALASAAAQARAARGRKLTSQRREGTPGQTVSLLCSRWLLPLRNHERWSGAASDC